MAVKKTKPVILFNITANAEWVFGVDSLGRVWSKPLVEAEGAAWKCIGQPVEDV